MHILAKVFLPYYVKEFDRIRRENINLAHYTNILSGYSILKKKEIWLRNITKMSDNMEVKWGLELFKIFLYDNEKCLYNRLIQALAKAQKDENYWQNILDDLINNFYDKYAKNTYIFSLTECVENTTKELNEELFIKICGNSGIEFIFNNKINNEYGEKLDLSRVAYFDGLTFKEELSNLIESIERNTDIIKREKLEEVLNLFKQAVIFAILSIKHPYFKTENEWRIIYCKKFRKNIKDPITGKDLITEEYVEVKGNLEKVCKINLDLLNKEEALSKIIAVCNEEEVAALLKKEIDNWDSFSKNKFICYKTKRDFIKVN